MQSRTNELVDLKKRVLKLDNDVESKEALRRENKVLHAKILALESQVERLCTVRDNMHSLKPQQVRFEHHEDLTDDSFILNTKIAELKTCI